MASIFIDSDIATEVQDCITDAVAFCIGELMPEFEDRIEIDIAVEEDFGYDAQAGVHDDETKKRPTRFEITIDAECLCDLNKVIETLCHEMVHIKQYATGELATVIENDVNVFYWKGERIPQYGNVSLATYYNYPWEVEAYGLEKALYYRWYENQNLINTLKELVA
jgi:hypothetical protein